MRPIDAQNRLPEVATDQALDRTLKHLRKLRWIGKESEAENLHCAGLEKAPQGAIRQTATQESFVSFAERFPLNHGLQIG